MPRDEPAGPNRRTASRGRDAATRGTAPDPPRAILYAHPWAIVDRGIDASLAEIRACGIDGIQLALSYHVADSLTPRGRSRRVVSGGLGGLQFDPALSDVDWPFPPAVSPHVARAGSVEDLLRAVAHHGLTAVAWLVYLYTHALASSRPQLSVRDVYGEPSGSHLCPRNPDVRAYVLALTRAALKLGPVSGLHAESLGYHAFDHGMLNLKSALQPTPRARRLLSLCYCEHCREAATAYGVEVEAFGREARQQIDEELLTPPGATRTAADSDAFAGDAFGEALEEWTRLQARSVVRLHDDVFDLAVAAGVGKGASLVEAEDSTVDGLAAQSVRRRVDEVRFRLAPTQGGGEVAERVAESRRGVRPSVPTYAFVDLARFASERALGEAVERAVELGIKHYRFYEFSVLAPWHLEWIRGQQGAWLG